MGEMKERRCMSSQVDHIIEQITEELREIPGVIGVVLGGSRAKGTAKPDSDIDIGIYYDDTQGFKVEYFAKIAKRLYD